MKPKTDGQKLVEIITAAREDDSVIDIKIIGRWEDEEIVQGIIKTKTDGQKLVEFCDRMMKSNAPELFKTIPAVREIDRSIGNVVQGKWCDEHKPGKPCDHPGCCSHVSHPCETCGRIACGLKSV